jgi:hypothetical protein
VNSLVLLLRDVSFELESVAEYIPSTWQSGSSSTIGIGGRKEAMPEAGRVRTGVRDMLRVCKGSISHSEPRALRDGEVCALSEEDVGGMCKDLQRPEPAVLEPRPLRLGVVVVDKEESKESRFREDLGCNTWQMGGVGRGTSYCSLLDTVKTWATGERLSAGPASGEERIGFVLVRWPSSDFRRRAFVVGGMSSEPENFRVSF